MVERTNHPSGDALAPDSSLPIGSDSRRHADDAHVRRVRRGAKALISTGERALLVRERHADGSPFWTLPGGGARRTESLRAAAERELAEELRCECVVGDPLAEFWYVHESLRRTASVYTVLDCKLLTEPTPAAGEGIDELRWVSPSELPPRTLPQVRTVVRGLFAADARRETPAEAGTD